MAMKLKIVGSPHLGIAAAADQFLQRIPLGQRAGLLHNSGGRFAEPPGVSQQPDSLSHDIEEFRRLAAEFLGGDGSAPLAGFFPRQQHVGDLVFVRHRGTPRSMAA
ncbi:MAG: hypothetical protein LC104_16545 [Bacteroidales bacterium]|nr:hypothetical protein [Bacteroidales bacterium]